MVAQHQRVGGVDRRTALAEGETKPLAARGRIERDDVQPRGEDHVTHPVDGGRHGRRVAGRLVGTLPDRAAVVEREGHDACAVAPADVE
ncbi:MAG: hypothetical protein DWQ37_09590 [Planctomycetota bacterium]|nr:MAG: hypothetical protein DWQ37_09590 [Planctomycetota bacterium]